MSRKLALVTGGSRGIGKAVVCELAARGYDVAFCYRSNETEAADTRAQAETMAGGENPVRVAAHRCDVADHDAVTDWVRTVERELGPIEAAVNCAGITRDRPAVLMSQSEWGDVIDTNLTGLFNVCRSVAFPMLKRKRGSILNLSSVSGVFGNPGQANYSASKAGIIGLSRALAKELGPNGIRVNVVAPGLIETDMTADLPANHAQRMREATPLRRMGHVREVARTVAFLSSDDASYITGQVVGVDGGLVL